MACELTTGRTLDCKDAIGGIRTVFFMQVEDYVPTYTSDVLSAVTAATAYRYELPSYWLSFRGYSGIYGEW